MRQDLDYSKRGQGIVATPALIKRFRATPKQWPARVLGFCAALLAFLSCATPGFCQGDFYTAREPQTWDVNLGLAGGLRPTFPGSDRYRAIGLPVILIRYHDMVSLADDGLSLYWHTGKLRIGTAFTYEGGRLDHETSGIFDSGDNRLKGLGDVDSSLGVRAFVSYEFGPVYTDISATKYIGPDDKGILVSGGVSTPITTGRWIFRPYGRLIWANGDYMQTLFGVTPLQASRSLFPAFSASSGLENANGGMTVIYRLTGHWFAAVDGHVTQYLGDAAQSPITFSNTNAQVTAGVGYHF